MFYKDEMDFENTCTNSCVTVCLYLHSQVLHEAKNAAHLMKFGEEISPFS